jgi:hypothetical protein
VEAGRFVRGHGAGWRLPNRDQQARRRDEVDLLIADAVFIRERTCRQEEPVDVRPVALDDGAGSTAVAGMRNERLDDLRVDLDGKRRQYLFAGRVDEVGPAHGHLLRG